MPRYKATIRDVEDTVLQEETFNTLSEATSFINSLFEEQDLDDIENYEFIPEENLYHQEAYRSDDDEEMLQATIEIC